MEVGDLELLMLVNNYQQRFNEPTFSTLDDIPEALIIEVLDDANWCGEEDTFRAVAESEIELWDIAEQLAYDNFYSFGHDQDIAEEEGYDPDEMTDEDWDEYSGEIYGKDS